MTPKAELYSIGLTQLGFHHFTLHALLVVIKAVSRKLQTVAIDALPELDDDD
jgi:hypothetical protein